MLKNKEKNFANLGCCKEKNHDNSKKKYICLANSCNFSELLCHFCVLNSHSNHRIISFLSFAKQTSILFSQSLNDLSSLINSFEIQEVLCNKIDDVCQNLKKLLILIEDKIYERKKNLNSKINEAKYSLQKIICFNDKYFDNIFSANKDNNDLIKDDKNSNLIEKIIEIKNELLIEGNSCFKLRSFESLSSFYSGSFNESLMDQVYLSLKECTFALGAIIFPNIQIPENPQSITAFQLVQLHRFELKKNYIIKNLIQMPNSIIVASGHDNYLRYFKYTPQMSNVSIKTIEGHSAWIRSLASYGHFLASGSDDSALKIWKLSSTNILEQVHLVNSLEKMKAYYWSLIFINAGVIVAGRGQNDNYSIRLWDFEKYDKPKIILGHRNIVRSLIVIEEKVLVSISDDGSIKFWCLETFSLKKTILAHRKQINCIVHNKKKRLLATAGSDFLIKIWVTHGFYQSLLVFSQPDKILVLGSIDKLRLLITGSIYGFIKLWDWVDGSLKCNASVGMEIHSLLCKEEDETIFSGDSSGKITVWRVSSL